MSQSLLDTIKSAQSGEALANLARTYGITEAQAEAAVMAVIPEFARRFERNTLSRGGLADLVAALGDGHHQAILEEPRAWRDPGVTADGNAILDHVLGSKDRSRAVAGQAAQAAGLSDSLIKMMLPILAQMIMGAIAKYAKGGLGDILGRLPGGQKGGAGLPFPMPGAGSDAEPDERPRPSSRGQRGGGGSTGGGMGGGFELPRSDLPQGGFPMPPIPGSDGDGGGFGLPRGGASRQSNPLPPFGDDVPPQAQRRSSQGSGFPFPLPEGGGNDAPLPLPKSGDNNPYGDLSDILRRGGVGVDGSSLGGIVRNILGGLLGFQSRGIMGWLFRMIVLRFGWGLVMRILRGVLGR